MDELPKLIPHCTPVKSSFDSHTSAVGMIGSLRESFESFPKNVGNSNLKLDTTNASSGDEKPALAAAADRLSVWALFDAPESPTFKNEW
jgi:hypothetical protein